MSTTSPDPLLRGTRLLLLITMGLAVIAAIAIAIAVPVLIASPENVTINGHALSSLPIGGVVMIMAGLIAILALAFFFLRQLVAVIDSVKLGSPFVPQNARRLRIMGWLMLAMEMIGLLADPVQQFVARTVPEADVELSFSFTGFITALLLFILARIFEHGTRLAEDAEGTV